MKSLKKYVMGLVAMTIAIGAVTLMSMSAGVEMKVEKENTPQWFVHTGTNPSNAEEYEPLDTSSPACMTGNAVCAIKASPDSNNENQPSQTELEDVLDRNTPASFDSDEIRYKP